MFEDMTRGHGTFMGTVKFGDVDKMLSGLEKLWGRLARASPPLQNKAVSCVPTPERTPFRSERGLTERAHTHTYRYIHT